MANLMTAFRARSGHTNATFIMTELAPLIKHTTIDSEKLTSIDLRPRDSDRVRFGDRVIYRAKAAIREKNSVEVSHPDVAAPVAVRYAWAPFPLCNLYNTEEFATDPFLTDNWPWQTPAEPASLKSE